MDEVTVMFLAPMHAVFNTPPCIFATIDEGLAQIGDGRSVGDINMVGGFTQDADEGRNAIRVLASYQRLDSIIVFGKASASLGLPDLDELVPTTVRLRGQLSPLRCVRLPSPISEWWLESSNRALAGTAVKPLLVPPPTMITAGEHLAYDTMEFN